MKITITQIEAQALIAKAMNIPADKLKVSVKSLDLDIEAEIGTLSFGNALAAVAATSPLAEEVVAEEATVAESAPAPAKPKAKAKAKKKEAVVEEEIEEEEVDEDEDDIDFL